MAQHYVGELSAAPCPPGKSWSHSQFSVFSFQDLVSNALKYGGRRGRVEIRARAEEGRIEVSVSDSGKGISPQDIPHIFEPFFRGVEVSSRAIAGSGLGLSLVRRIAASHGGSVRVESPAGGGGDLSRQPAGGRGRDRRLRASRVVKA